MTQPKKWILGLLPLAGLVVASAWMRQERIETDLATRGGAGLAGAGLSWAKVEMNGRDAVLTGEAPSPDSQGLAVAGAERVFGIRRVRDATTVLPEATPFAFTAMRDATKITLAGVIPPGDARAAVLAAAQKVVPGATIVDELKTARGAAASFGAASAFGLSELAKLSQGTLTILDSTLSLTGRAVDLPKFHDVRKSLAAMPAGVTLGKGLGAGDILAPIQKPFVLTVQKLAGETRVSGFHASEEQRGRLASAVATFGKPVSITTEPADGAPANFSVMVAFGLGELGKLSDGRLVISDQTLSLSGRAPTHDAYDDVRAKLAALPAGAVLGTIDIRPPLITPFTFEAEKGSGGLVLRGFAPSQAMVDELASAARAVANPVNNQLRVADGVPAGDWGGAAKLMVAELGKLETGKASLANAQAAILGVGKGNVNEASVRADLQALPSGFQLVSAKIEQGVIRPYLFIAQRGEGQVTLSGFVPDQRTRNDIVEHTKKFFEGEQVVDTLQAGLGAPKDFLAAIRGALSEMSRLAPGSSLSLSDTSITVKGLAYFNAAKDEVSSDLRRQMPGSFQHTIDIALAPLPPPLGSGAECQSLYKDVLARGTVRFRSGSADLSDESRGLLDKLAVVTLRCPAEKIEIGGHTDSDGSQEMNLDLSRKRAEVVAAHMVRAGVEANRMTPVGFGPNKPVAPNDSAENKARNRRIEFIVN